MTSASGLASGPTVCAVAVVSKRHSPEARRGECRSSLLDSGAAVGVDTSICRRPTVSAFAEDGLEAERASGPPLLRRTTIRSAQPFEGPKDLTAFVPRAATNHGSISVAVVAALSHAREVRPTRRPSSASTAVQPRAPGLDSRRPWTPRSPERDVDTGEMPAAPRRLCRIPSLAQEPQNRRRRGVDERPLAVALDDGHVLREGASNAVPELSANLGGDWVRSSLLLPTRRSSRRKGIGGPSRWRMSAFV